MLRKSNIFLLATAAVLTAAIYYLANREPKIEIVIPKQSVYYLAGQKSNCLWVLHTLDILTKEENSMTRMAIGIPSATRAGALPGVIQVTKGKELIMAFNLPGMSVPVVLTTSMPSDLPLKKATFSWLGSDMLNIHMFNSRSECLESVQNK